MTKERQAKPACPHCQHWDSKVMQGWGDPRARYYLRRRKCLRCQRTFHTEERVIEMAGAAKYPTGGRGRAATGEPHLATRDKGIVIYD